MSHSNEGRMPDELLHVVEEMRGQMPEASASGLELDAIKRRAMTQASRSSGQPRLKGMLMRSRGLTTMLLLLGLFMTGGLAYFAATGNVVPGPSGLSFDAAQSQYNNDDDDDDGDDDGDDDDDDDDDNEGGDGIITPPPGALGSPPGQGGQPTLTERGVNDCRLFNQNFGGGGNSLDGCSAAVEEALTRLLQGQPPNAVQACSGLSQRRERGHRRSDYAACVIAVTRAVNSMQGSG